MRNHSSDFDEDLVPDEASSQFSSVSEVDFENLS